MKELRVWVVVFLIAGLAIALIACGVLMDSVERKADVSYDYEPFLTAKELGFEWRTDIWTTESEPMDIISVIFESGPDEFASDYTKLQIYDEMPERWGDSWDDIYYECGTISAADGKSIKGYGGGYSGPEGEGKIRFDSKLNKWVFSESQCEMVISLLRAMNENPAEDPVNKIIYGGELFSEGFHEFLKRNELTYYWNSGHERARGYIGLESADGETVLTLTVGNDGALNIHCWLGENRESVECDKIVGLRYSDEGFALPKQMIEIFERAIEGESLASIFREIDGAQIKAF